MTFAEWIEKRGAGVIADRMGISPNTVYSWSHRNQIPRLVWPEFLLEFCEHAYSDLIAMERASKAAKK